MPREVAMEGRDGNAALEGTQNGSLNEGISIVSDRELEVGSQLLGGDARLDPVTQSFNCLGS